MYNKKEFDMIDAYYSELAHTKAQIPDLCVVFVKVLGVIFVVYAFCGFII
jgi:hypothetical protein